MRFSLFYLLTLGGSGVLAIQRIKFSTCPGAACIFPVDGAEFLTGAKFDVRLEIHNEEGGEANGEFQVTVSKLTSGKEGIPVKLEEFFTPLDKSPQLERWTFDYAKDAVDYYKSLDAVKVQGSKDVDDHKGLEGEKSMLKEVKVASKIWRNVHFTEPGNYIATTTYNDGKIHKVEWIVRAASCKRIARNAILFIADGTTINMITAARVMARKQRNGKFNRKFELDNADYIGHILTHSLDSMMVDSANSASAYHTGHKTAVNALGVYPDSSPNHFDDPKQELLAELARRRSEARGGKMAIGIVTTAEVQDATPAAVFAHTRRRGDKAEIVDQLLYGAKNASIPVIADVYLGGGGAYFHNKTGGKSYKGQDYYKKFESEFGYKVVTNGKQLKEFNGDQPLLGVFNKGNLNVFVDRQMKKENMKGNKASPVGDSNDALDQPGLVDMTKITLDLLKKRGGDAGFFAMIEAASPDKMMHVMDFHRSLMDLIEFDNAIKAAIEWVRKNDPSTLIVITADHGHGFDVYGSVDTEILNNASESKHNLNKRLAIGAYENAGWPDYEDKDGDGYPDDLNVRTVFAAATNNHPDMFENYQMNRTKARIPALPDVHDKTHKYPIVVANPDFGEKGIFYNGNLPIDEEQTVHSMTDVGVFAFGPGAQLFGRVMDSTEVFFNFAEALALGDVDPKHCQKCRKKRQPYY